ncbi:hypothetical protein [Vulcanisaeta souniana]|nr:hypothetical protein [Vulcanisaeta souniana]
MLRRRLERIKDERRKKNIIEALKKLAPTEGGWPWGGSNRLQDAHV